VQPGGFQNYSGPRSINWHKIKRTVLRVAKSYGFACVGAGALGAAAGGGAGFAVGCVEGIIDVGAEKHAPPAVAAGVTVASVLIGGHKLFIETGLGEKYVNALLEALGAAFGG
jgi:hypothetical protein